MPSIEQNSSIRGKDAQPGDALVIFVYVMGEAALGRDKEGSAGAGVWCFRNVHVVDAAVPTVKCKKPVSKSSEVRGNGSSV